MKFSIVYKQKEFKGNPIYIAAENSLYYEPWMKNDFSVMIGDGYNSIDICLTTGKAMQVTGCNPQANWLLQKLNPPITKTGILKFEINEKEVSGTGKQYATEWHTFHDREKGWICIGEPEIFGKCEWVEFAKNTIAVVKNYQISAVWVKPSMT